MKKRNYKSFIIVISYLMLLRIVLNITVGISIFNFGMLFDLVLVMFWVNLFTAIFRKNNEQKTYYIFIIIIASIFIIGDSIYYEYFISFRFHPFKYIRI